MDIPPDQKVQDWGKKETMDFVGLKHQIESKATTPQMRREQVQSHGILSADRLQEESKNGTPYLQEQENPYTSPLRPVDSTSSQGEKSRSICIRGKDYILFKGRILEDQEASKIYNSYLEMLTSKQDKPQTEMPRQEPR